MSGQIRVLVLPFLPAEQRFDDTALVALQRQAEVLSCRSVFFQVGGEPYWSLAIRCRVPAGRRPAATAQAGRTPTAYPLPFVAAPGAPTAPHAAPRVLVAETDLPLYETLRAWRAEVADRWGVPVYVVLSNRQLAEIVRVKPRSLSALGAIPGIGASRLKKLGREILTSLGIEPAPGGDRNRVPQGETPGSAPAEAVETAVTATSAAPAMVV